MRKFFQFVWSGLKSEFILYLFSLFIFASFFIILFSKLPPQIPLFYSRPSSDRQVTDLFMIILVPIITFIVLLSNRIIIARFFKEEAMVKNLIYKINLILVIVSIYIFVKIFFLAT